MTAAKSMCSKKDGSSSVARNLGDRFADQQATAVPLVPKPAFTDRMFPHTQDADNDKRCKGPMCGGTLLPSTMDTCVRCLMGEVNRKKEEASSQSGPMGVSSTKPTVLYPASGGIPAGAHPPQPTPAATVKAELRAVEEETPEQTERDFAIHELQNTLAAPPKSKEWALQSWGTTSPDARVTLKKLEKEAASAATVKEELPECKVKLPSCSGPALPLTSTCGPCKTLLENDKRSCSSPGSMPDLKELYSSAISGFKEIILRYVSKPAPSEAHQCPGGFCNACLIKDRHLCLLCTDTLLRGQAEAMKALSSVMPEAQDGDVKPKEWLAPKEEDDEPEEEGEVVLIEDEEEEVKEEQKSDGEEGRDEEEGTNGGEQPAPPTTPPRPPTYQWPRPSAQNSFPGYNNGGNYWGGGQGSWHRQGPGWHQSHGRGSGKRYHNRGQQHWDYDQHRNSMYQPPRREPVHAAAGAADPPPAAAEQPDAGRR